MRFIFVRHGEPNYADDCLTENGIMQAKATAVRLKEEPIKEIYSSPMGRARQTASFTAMDHSLEVKVLNYMHEISWGDKDDKDEDDPDAVPLGGHPWSLGYKLLTENPDFAQNDNWKSHPYFANNKCMDYFEGISDGIDKLLLEKGYRRDSGYYLCERENNDTIALFAHGGSGGILFSHVLNIPFPVVLTTLPYGVCSVSVIAFDGMQGDMVIPRFEIFNDMKHLDKVIFEKMIYS